MSAYCGIAEQFSLSPSTMLFLSDIKEELDAARNAGWQTIQLICAKPDRFSSLPQVHSFADMILR